MWINVCSTDKQKILCILVIYHHICMRIDGLSNPKYASFLIWNNETDKISLYKIIFNTHNIQCKYRRPDFHSDQPSFDSTDGESTDPHVVISLDNVEICFSFSTKTIYLVMVSFLTYCALDRSTPEDHKSNISSAWMFVEWKGSNF